MSTIGLHFVRMTFCYRSCCIKSSHHTLSSAHRKERIRFPIRPHFSAILILSRNLYFTDYFIQLLLQNIDSICFEYVSFPFSVSPDLWKVSKPGCGLCQKIPVRFSTKRRPFLKGLLFYHIF